MTIYKSTLPAVALTDLSITDRLVQGLDQRGDAAALIDGPTGRHLTATQLKEQIQRLAGGLSARGQGKGTVTALMAPNVPEFVTVYHGVLYAGGTVTTVNPTYTAEELTHQLRDSGATLLVTVPAFLETARAGAEGTDVTEIVVIGAAEGAIPLEDLMGKPLAAQVKVDVANDIAVLPYSSGTTGLPKGVMLSHRNLVVNVDQTLAATTIRPGDMTVAFLPFFHIYGQTVLMNCYLARGAGLITMPRFDLEHFLQLTQDHAVRDLYVVPPVTLALAKAPAVANYDLSSIEMVLSAAAPLGAALGEEAAARLGCTVVQGWGMTEIAPVGCFSTATTHRGGAVGIPVSNTELRIVDPDSGQDAEEGEVWVRGPQVMLGYLHNEKATRACLSSDGWLRTGDLGRVDEDGFLFIHDRLKELIKVKGFQVAPAELEAVLLTHTAVADAAVIGVPDDEAGERPAAFVVRKPEAEVDADALKAHVLDHLSHYKALASVTFVDSIPKSASGKILRRLLRDTV